MPFDPEHRGARLFDDAIDVGALRLIDSRSFRSGVVLMTYATGG